MMPWHAWCEVMKREYKISHFQHEVEEELPDVQKTAQMGYNYYFF